MHFNIRRYLYGLSKRRLWLLLILIPPIAYLILASIRSDRFTIKQTISISKNSPVALASSPTGFRSMEYIASNPDHFFLHPFALRKLYSYFYAGTDDDLADRQFHTLIESVVDNLSMALPSEDRVVITYHGASLNLGETLLVFYSQRLIQKAEEGLSRSKPRDSKAQIPFLVGGMDVAEHRSVWRSERFFPLVLMTIVSIAFMLIFLGVLEWTDPSLKSERQVARYLDLPILGSVPDLNKITAAMATKSLM